MKNYYLKVVQTLVAIFCVASLSAATFNPKFEGVSHPRLLVNQAAIDSGRAKMQKYDWAAKSAAELIKTADNFKVPQLKYHTGGRPVKVWKSLAYKPQQMEDLFNVALAWSLTDNPAYLAKMKSFIADICDKEKGYLTVGAATTGVEVHEGGFFLYLAAVCDILYGKDIFTAEEKQSIEQVMRMFLESAKEGMHPNGIMNHQASSNAGAVMVAMFLKDKELFNYFVDSPGGMIDHIAKGVMPDGWWFEATANYCYLVTDVYFRMAQTFQNNKMDLYHKRIPSRKMDKDFHNAADGFTGMKFAVWGPEPKPYRTLRDMAMGYYPLMDENAVLLASNDSGLKYPEPFYELAYKEYKTKELAWVLSKTDRTSWEALFYGANELPEVADPRTKSATRESVGITALRSQSKSQKPEEQVQAFVKYGSHGGWHGHYDRTSLQALDRFGHKYFGTEMCWFGYGKAQYKELVQASPSHNMVVVNGLQQEAVPSSQPIFFCGETMQLSLTETKARWRPVPRHNLDKFPPWDDFDFTTEPILQRRLTLVADEYVLMADYVSSEAAREYDCLIHPLGFKSVDGANKVGEPRERISNADWSPYKYFTNLQWYKGGAEPVKFVFDDKGFGLDVHLLYPHNANIFYAHYPTTGKHSKGTLKNDPDRRTVGVRVNAKDVVFISLVEPYKGASKVEKVDVVGEDEITVYLTCGAKQNIKITGLKGEAKSVKVSMTTTAKDGKTIIESN